MDRAYFDKPEWLNQSHDGGFSRGAAWLDILALCNQKATTGFVRGINMPLERGDCAYSKVGLSKRWGRSQSWVSTTLTIWERDGRIRIKKSDNETTIIFITNYDAWQTGLLAVLTDGREQTASKSGADREQIETDRDRDRDKNREPRGEGEGQHAAGPPRIVLFEHARKFFEDNASGYDPDAVYEQWLYYDALRDPKTGEWQKPRGQFGGMVRISDWRSELANALLRFGQKKNGVSTARPARSPAQARFELSKELEAVSERLEAAYEVGAPPDPVDERREKELQAQIAKMEAAA